MLGAMASRSRAKRRAQPRPPVSEAGKRTREALLDAGSTVAERAGLAGLSVNAVVAEAELAKGTFYVHFADRDAFLDALHERFHANIGRAISAAVGDLPYGAERLSVGVGAYLDACLAQRAVKPLLREMRAGPTARTRWRSARALPRLSDPPARDGLPRRRRHRAAPRRHDCGDGLARARGRPAGRRGAPRAAPARRSDRRAGSLADGPLWGRQGGCPRGTLNPARYGSSRAPAKARRPRRVAVATGRSTGRARRLRWAETRRRAACRSG